MRRLFKQISSIHFPRPVIKFLGFVVIFLVTWYLAVFLIIAALRLVYPFELEWIEGAYLDQALRISQGYFPYSSPNVYLIPLSKTPLFFYLAAGLIKVFGAGFLAPRMISIIATIGICGLLIWQIKLETRSWVPGITAAGIYIASYRMSGAWMDLAKTDSLFLLILLAAFIIGQRAQRRRGWVLSGVLFALAYFTKQLALPIILALAVVSSIARRGKNWIQWITAFVIGIGLFWVLDYFSQGWFSFYTLETGTSHTRISDIDLFWKKLIPVMWPALILASIYVVSVFKRSRLIKLELPPKDWENLAFGGILVITSWMIFLKVWTYDNGLMMAALGLAFLSGLGLAEMYRTSIPEAWTDTGNAGLVVSLVLAIAQLGLLIYNPIDQLPTRQDKLAGEKIVLRVKQLTGDVLIFNHGFYSHLAGKNTFLHSAPYSDVLGADIEKSNQESYRRRQAVLDMFDQAIMNQFFDWIILDDPNASWTPYYLFVEDITPEGDDLIPVTGVPARPASLTVKNPIARGGAMPMIDPTYDFLFTTGWLSPENPGRWASGPRTEMEVFLQRDRYSIKLTMEPKCVDSVPVVEKMNVGWNEQVLDQVSFDSCDSQTVSISLPKKIIRKSANNLWFEFEKARADQNSANLIEEAEPLVKIKSMIFSTN